MELEWEDRKTKRGEAMKCRAALPGRTGWINLTQYGAGRYHERGFALHYTADRVPGGLPQFSGMLFLENWHDGMDALKSAATELVKKDMDAKIAAHAAKIEALRLVSERLSG